MANNWRTMPPRSWLRRQKNKDLSLQKVRRLYYKEHPEHKPPAKAICDVYARDARQGDPDALIRWLRDGGPLGPVAVELIAECLEQTRKKSFFDAQVREAEQYLIARRYDDLKAAHEKKIAEKIAVERGRTRRHVFAARAAYIKRKKVEK